MSEELVSRKELSFQLYEVLDTEALCERERFSEHNKDTFDAVMDTADKIAREKFAPHNRKADLNEPTFDGENVHMIPEVKEAFDTYAESGLIAGRFDFEDGGMQLPETIMMACAGYFMAANPSSTGYSFLTVAAANVIKNFASQALKEKFMPRMLTGEFTGTMALTEPHAGSSLADITTNAKPNEDGSYRIKGSKMFISAGDHQLSNNIVHLVLAKIQGAPAGVKGISLFVVPKFRLDENGEPAERNDVSLAGLIHKMGYRGTTSTVLSFGEKDDCHGYLVGEEHQGLKYMFLMMNEARLGVGFGAAMVGYAGYRYSLAYAKERTQGRVAPHNKPTDKAATIIQHGDVKRMLLAQKSYVEGGMALCFYAARLVDELHTLESPEAKQRTAELLDLLTPVVKAWPSEFGPKANDLAIQILGGSGYTREYPVEQCWRDNRLNPIHEGTNGIQALDLMTRKLWQANGSGLVQLQKMMSEDFAKAQHQASKRLIADLQPYLAKLQKLIPVIGAELKGENQNSLLANASCFLTIFGQIVVSWMWIRQAITAEAALNGGSLSSDDEAFYRGKLQAAKYFIDWELTVTDRDFKILNSMNDSCSNMQEAWF
ncbi:acyl-CoA dehydrogenase [Paraglaciecola polaris]|uniref:Butyryl-CoA dehydrogenase n=1 Tax=Paraglaciecola polaris LMG 21857 TaxID=1129793 RepID=K6Z9U9_9ALTE|nr:acyl-CoA dehydrogenase [Paraglaciecola polaris]GAC32896.1 butyryl-CoA dehydrogenase [Paraglaciecola polaris LMG 21857]|tara:strand:- start:7245 stop:9050 length:1806 start_codon:yes stop_codon:yes gene_type:complete